MHHSSSPFSALALPAKNHILLPTGLVTMKPHIFPLAHGAHTRTAEPVKQGQTRSFRFQLRCGIDPKSFQSAGADLSVSSLRN